MKRLKKNKIFAFLIVTLLLLLTACGSNKIPNATNWELADFEHINQDNEPFGLSDLKGNITVATLIFTNCTTVCSPMTANMAKLQVMAADQQLPVQFLSFSVDPERDDPETLKEFAERFDADFNNWNFITGYSQKYIEEFGQKNFKTWIVKPKNDPHAEVIHGTSFYLIDQNGIIVKSYDGTDVPYEEILDHIQILANE